MKIDLHIHTVFSDGVFTPEKIVDTAIDAGLDAIAITDHDNVLAYPIAVSYSEKIAKEAGRTPLEIISGVEINTIYKNTEIHILGYFMNRDDADFKAMLKQQQNARIVQTNEIITLLNKKEGIHVTFDKIKSPCMICNFIYLAERFTSDRNTVFNNSLCLKERKSIPLYGSRIVRILCIKALFKALQCFSRNAGCNSAKFFFFF